MSYLASANWLVLGDNPYRQVRIYESMLWGSDVDLADSMVVAAPYGGPIAVARTQKQHRITMMRAGSEYIYIYTAAGKQVARVDMRPSTSGRLVTMSWTATEQLLCVYSSGAVDVFDAIGERCDTSFELLPSLSMEEVVMVATCATGMAAVSRSSDAVYKLYLVPDLESPAPIVVHSTGLAPTAAPTGLAVIPAALTTSGRMEALLATPDQSLVVIDSASGGTDMQLDALLPQPVRAMAVSPSGKYVAAVCENGVLVVLVTSFDSKLLEFDPKASSLPDQVVWCGEDAVCLCWAGNGFLLVGPFGEFNRYSYDEPVYVVQDIDCLRVVTPTQHEMVQRVPAALRSIRSIGSTAPSAMLFEASSMFQDQDAKCDDYLRRLVTEGTLRDAILECISAAMHEVDPVHQRAMLRAASTGKNFDQDFDSDLFVDACKKLRVVNALRALDAGMPVTVPQFDALTAPVVIDRLQARHAHRLALHLCRYLGLPEDAVLVHWACAKVRASSTLPDEAVRDLIRAKLADAGPVSFADIAAAADTAGRRRLATMLLNFEPRAADQVPILLQMREGRLALSKAIDSGDTDLIYLAMMHLRRAIRAGEDREDAQPAGPGRGGGPAGGPPRDGADEDAAFVRAVLPYPAAVNLLAVYCRSQDPALLQKLCVASGRYVEAGMSFIREAYACTALPDRCVLLKRAVDVFRDAERGGAGTAAASEAAATAAAEQRAEAAFFAKMAEEQLALLSVQRQMERDVQAASGGRDGGAIGPAFLDLSVAETVFNAVILGDAKRASQLAKDFKVPDVQFYIVKVRALAHKRDWAALQAFANERRPPIGFKPFAEACMREGAAVEAKKYIARMGADEAGVRIDMLVELGEFTDAAELAAKARDIDRLQHIGSLAPTPSAREVVDKALAALSGSAGGRGR